MGFNSKIKWILYCLLIIFGFSAGYLYVSDPCLLDILSKEDGVLEVPTAIFYFAAFLTLIYVFKRKSSKNLWYLIFAITFLMIAGEEISWGQRLLGFSSPELLSTINVQHEFNFHNIKGIHENIRGVRSTYYIDNMRYSTYNRQIYKLYARFLQKNKTAYYSFVAFERVYNWHCIYGISKTVSW